MTFYLTYKEITLNNINVVERDRSFVAYDALVAYLRLAAIYGLSRVATRSKEVQKGGPSLF